MIGALATGWGRCIGRYGRATVTDASLLTVMDVPAYDNPCIWIDWHECNLIAILAHRIVFRRPAVALVPLGLGGKAMQGWLEALDVEAIPVLGAERAGLALKHMRRALNAGYDVMIAADGPNGPRRQVKSGALWLSNASGVAVYPAGCAATPAVRLPRWDRHVVPLPGAQATIVFGSRLSFDGEPRSDMARNATARRLNELMERAAAALEPAVQAGSAKGRTANQARTAR